MLTILLLFSVSEGLAAASAEYDYSEPDTINIKKSGGDRLVGARAINADKYKFLVGWNPYGLNNIFFLFWVLDNTFICLICCSLQLTDQTAQGPREEEGGVREDHGEGGVLH